MHGFLLLLLSFPDLDCNLVIAQGVYELLISASAN